MKKTVLLIAGIALSVVCLWFVLRNQNFSELAAAAESIRWGWVVLSLIVFYIGFYLRAVRWRCFFPRDTPVTSRRIFGPMMLGYTLNSLFPFRLGEPARAVIVGRREKASIPAALASVVAERVVDVLTLLATMVVVFATVDFQPFSYEFAWHERTVTFDQAWLRSFARNTSLYLALPMCVAIALLMSRRVRAFLSRVMAAMPFLPNRFAKALDHLMHTFARGFEGLRSPLIALWIAVLSVVIWLSAAWSIQLLGPALGVHMTTLEAAAVMVIICVAITLPATPGYWGLYEIGFVFAGQLLGLKASPATLTALALLVHLSQYVPIVLFGVIWAAANGLSISEAARAAQEVEEAEEEEEKEVKS